MSQKMDEATFTVKIGALEETELGVIFCLEPADKKHNSEWVEASSGYGQDILHFLPCRIWEET